MPNKILALGLIGGLFLAGTSRGDEIDKKTILTVNEPLIVPGKQLQPGKYVMKLADSQSDRHIVQIFNEDQSQLITTILAIPNRRTTQDEDTSLMYWETPAGPALRAWFFPGDVVGQEFAYPKETAARIVAANRGAQIATYEGPETATPAELAAAPVKRSSENDTFAERSAASPKPTEAEPQAANQPVAAPKPAAEAGQDTTLLAQNQPPPANPAKPAQPARDNTPARENAQELPATASPIGWVTMAGFLSLAGAFFVRRWTTTHNVR